MITEFLTRRQAEALTDNITSLAHMLQTKNLCCATAESCTGGLLGFLLTSLPGSSRWFRGGIIAYDNDVKFRLLGVSRMVLDHYGAVSAETAARMAEGACRAVGANMAMALTGVAGPDGGTPEKPVGTVWLGLAAPGLAKTSHTILLQLEGTRQSIREQAAQLAVIHALALLKSIGSPH